jgi:omega-hydroxy-beta-dihydromenaquinone-9 sulfotransferase
MAIRESKIMKVEKPIFIFGTGRSGTTIFHQILSNHPNVAWLSSLCNKYPDKPFMNGLILRAIGYPLIGRLLRKTVKPVECYDFWEYHCKGFSRPFRDLLEEDVTIKTKGNIQKIMSKIVSSNRNRLLIKITGWPRIRFLYEIFNDAKFIHVMRDGRAVVNSLINVDFWWGWYGDHNWRWGELTEAQKKDWERFDKSFIALAGIQWKILMDAIEDAKKYVDKKNILEVKYENLCSDPLTTFKEVIEFCELKNSKYLFESINNYSLRNTNSKWKKELTDEQQRILENVIGDYLKRYGYS